MEKLRIDNLKELDLTCNQISDIKLLEKVKFENLKELNLIISQISDIKVLEKVINENLETLCLNDDQINKNIYSSLLNNLRNKIIYIFNEKSIVYRIFSIK